MKNTRTALSTLAAALLAAGCASLPGSQPGAASASPAVQESISANALNAQGIAHSQRGQAALAEQSFRAALAQAPSDARTHNNLGYHWLAQGRLAEAVSAFERAIALDPRNEYAQVNLRTARQAAQAQAQARAEAEAQARSKAAEPPALDPQSTVALEQVSAGVYELRPAAPSAPAATAMPSAPAAAAPASAQTAAPQPPAAAVRLEIANGNGRAGLARRVATLLERPARLTNVQPYATRASRIEYVPGAEQAARELSAQLPVAVPLAPVAHLDRAGVRVLLGKDFPHESASLAARPVQHARASNPVSQP